MPAVGATETRVKASVATLAELSGSASLRGVDDSAMSSGDLAWVEDQDCFYTLKKSSSALVDSPSIVYSYTAQLSVVVGEGRWYRGPALIDNAAYTARGVLTSLAAYTESAGVITANAAGAIGAQDGLTLAAGDLVVLPKAVAVAALEAGPYVVTAVGDGSNPYVLTRPLWWQDGADLLPAVVIQVGGEGTKWDGSQWKTMCAAGLKIGTGDPKLYPQFDKGVTGALSGAPGTITITAKYIFAATSTILATKDTPAGTAGFLSIPVATVTAGNGNGQFVLNSSANETSTVKYSIINW